MIPQAVQCTVYCTLTSCPALRGCCTRLCTIFILTNRHHTAAALFPSFLVVRLALGQVCRFEELLEGMADVSDLMSAAERWQRNFKTPLPLGAKSRLSIVTCMDSRILPETMFGLGVGDAEVNKTTYG